MYVTVNGNFANGQQVAKMQCETILFLLVCSAVLLLNVIVGILIGECEKCSYGDRLEGLEAKIVTSISRELQVGNGRHLLPKSRRSFKVSHCNTGLHRMIN